MKFLLLPQIGICDSVERRINAKQTKNISRQIKANRDIRSPQLVVIDDEGNKLGLLSREEALSLAEEKGLDLVEVNPNAQPPVAKIMDYGKFAYELQKKERKMRAGQKAQELKGIRIKFKTSENDLNTKIKQTEKFLAKGNKVRIEIFLRGRERAHADMAKERIKTFLEKINEEHRVIDPIKKSPRGFAVTIVK